MLRPRGRARGPRFGRSIQSFLAVRLDRNWARNQCTPRRPSCFGGVINLARIGSSVTRLPIRVAHLCQTYLSATDDDLCSLAGRWYDFICDSIGWL